MMSEKKISYIDVSKQDDWASVNLYLNHKSNGQMRKNAHLIKTYVGTQGGAKYKVHAGFGWSKLNKKKQPVIDEVMIKVRPENSMVSAMVKESMVSFNSAINDKNTFADQCNEISKGGFLGIVCNYFLENMEKIVDYSSDFRISTELQFEPQNRYGSVNKDLERLNDA